MAGKIIVPLDGSHLAEQALAYAIRIAQKKALALRLVDVVADGPTGYFYSGEEISELIDALCADAEKYLEHIKTKIERFGVSVDCIVRIGDAAEVIAAVADEEMDSLVVMSTHGRTGLSRWALGSVADKVLRLTARPVLIIRSPKDELIMLDQISHPNFKRIVVPLDGSSFAEAVLEQVKSLALAYQAELYLFRSLPLLPPNFIEPSASITIHTEWQEKIRNEATRYLENKVNELRHFGLTAYYETGGEPPTDRILDYAESVEADLIAITTHARSGWGRFVLGSVADRIIRSGRWPVLAVKP